MIKIFSNYFFGLSLLCASTPLTMAHQFTYAEDYPVALPAYFQEGLRFGITGTLKLRLHFEDSKVMQVEVLYSDLKSASGDEEHAALVRAFTSRVIHSYRRWFTFIVSSFSTEIETEFRIDPELEQDERVFRITYGEEIGMISKVIVIGPDLQNEK